MEDNQAAVAAAAPKPEPKSEMKAEPEPDNDDDDPLEAFMRSQIAPAVQQKPLVDRKPSVPAIKMGASFLMSLASVLACARSAPCPVSAVTTTGFKRQLQAQPAAVCISAANSPAEHGWCSHWSSWAGGQAPSCVLCPSAALSS